MNKTTEEIIKYIEDKKNERQNALIGLELSKDERDMQQNLFLGVDMVIRWINEII